VGTAWSIPCISSFFLLVVAETHGFCAAPIALCPHWKRRQKTLWTEHRERGDGRFKILDLFAYECCTPAVPPGRLVGRLRSRLRKTTQRGIRVGTPGAEWKGRAVGGRLLIGLFFLSFHCTFFAVLYLKKKKSWEFSDAPSPLAEGRTEGHKPESVKLGNESGLDGFLLHIKTVCRMCIHSDINDWESMGKFGSRIHTILGTSGSCSPR